MNLYTVFTKRFLDLTLSILLIVLMSPIFLIVTIVLSFGFKGNPLFIQLRPGKDEKLIKVIKFRTMNDLKDVNGNLLSDSERLTVIGRIIRKTSLDELPQLFNVLIGDMSLVGPRPLLVSYLPFYSDEERVRHSIKPGITGLAQINGRNTLGWKDRLSYDIKYVENICLELDLKILLITFQKVFFSTNIVIDPGKAMQNLDEERKI